VCRAPLLLTQSEEAVGKGKKGNLLLWIAHHCRKDQVCTYKETEVTSHFHSLVVITIPHQ